MVVFDKECISGSLSISLYFDSSFLNSFSQRIAVVYLKLILSALILALFLPVLSAKQAFTSAFFFP